MSRASRRPVFRFRTIQNHPKDVIGALGHNPFVKRRMHEFGPNKERIVMQSNPPSHRQLAVPGFPQNISAAPNVVDLAAFRRARNGLNNRKVQRLIACVAAALLMPTVVLGPVVTWLLLSIRRGVLMGARAKSKMAHANSQPAA
jgi:hypothetical protein